MSFRWFIYACALCGGWAAFGGWLMGRALAPDSAVAQAGVKGMLLGILVALSLGVVDALWNAALHHKGQLVSRIFVAVLVGCLGGLIGGMFGQLLYGWTEFSLFLIFGWSITGLLVGVSLGVFEMALCLARGQSTQAARRKLVNCLLGGTVGGLLGGLFYGLSRGFWKVLFGDKSMDLLWSPSAIGFVVLGACIGLVIGLAQVILRQAWIRVDRGFRAGREMLLSKGETTIGRAEGCDVGLFGDAAVARQHARILLREDGGYYLADDGSPTGTFVNESRVTQPVPLRAGDLIRVGSCVLRFDERQKR